LQNLLKVFYWPSLCETETNDAVANHRGPLKSEFRVTVINAQRLSKSDSIEMAVRVECEFGGHKMSSVTQNEVNVQHTFVMMC
jgi:hypothetical protein